MKKIVQVFIIAYLVSTSTSFAIDATRNYEPLKAVDILTSRGQFQDAKEYLSSYISIHPDAIVAFHKAIEVELSMKNYNEAKLLLDKAIIKKNNDFYTNYLMAKYYFIQKDYNNAEKYAKYSTSIKFHNPLAYSLLGDVYYNTGKFGAAYTKYCLANKYDPSLIEPYVQNAKLFIKDKKYKQAYNEIQKARDINTKNPDALFFLGQITYTYKQYNDTVDYLTRAIDNNLENPIEANYILAQTYQKLGELDKSFDKYYNVLVLNPKYKDIEAKIASLRQSYSSITEDNLQETKSCVYNFDREPKLLFEADYNLIRCNYTKAMELYQKVLVINPESIGARKGIVEFYYAQASENKIPNLLNYFQDSVYINNNKSEYLKIERII